MTDLARTKWRKSSHSGGNNGQCVEVGHGAGIRDSKNADGGVIRLSGDAWAAFLVTAKAEQFDA